MVLGVAWNAPEQVVDLGTFPRFYGRQLGSTAPCSDQRRASMTARKVSGMFILGACRKHWSDQRLDDVVPVCVMAGMQLGTVAHNPTRRYAPHAGDIPAMMPLPVDL